LLAYPATQRFRCAADLGCDGFDRCHCELYSLAASLTMRTARSMTSGEYLGCFFIAPFSQTMEPLQNPGRFSHAQTWGELGGTTDQLGVFQLTNRIVLSWSSPTEKQAELFYSCKKKPSSKLALPTRIQHNNRGQQLAGLFVFV
jgi:hypothetical protein